MFDETQNRIINATMELVMERGYTGTTTKDIASRAEVNECTIFRKFKGKKEIVLSAMTLPKWHPDLRKEDFAWTGDLESDLISFSKTYMKKVTPQMVKVSIGLRTPELFPDTADGILKVPEVFKEVLMEYFREMYDKGKLNNDHFESMAMAVLSMNFGFVFLRASFGDKITSLENEQYIVESIRSLVSGISV